MPDEELGMTEEYRQDLHRRLRFVYEALSKTTCLCKIFDQEWYQTISKEIERADLSHPLQMDSALMFSEFDHFFEESSGLRKLKTWLCKGGRMNSTKSQDLYLAA